MNFTRRSKVSAGAVNITSLMDVLTIILIFLLVNYSDNAVEIELPDGVNLPHIKSKPGADVKEDIVIVVGKHQIDVNSKVIKFRSFAQEKEDVFQKISLSLLALKGQSLDQETEPARRISIKADENVQYEAIDTILLAAASEGITDIDFVAMTKED